MADNPFFQMDQPQAAQPQASLPVSAPTAAPVGQNNPFFSMKDPPPGSSGAGGTPQEQPKSYSGAILPMSRNADGSMNWFDPNAGIVGDVKRMVTGMPDLAHQVGQETASNDATPETAGRMAALAGSTTGGDMLAPGISGNAVRSAVAVPAAQELKRTGGAGFDALRDLGVHYDTGHTADLADATAQDLNRYGPSDVVAPDTHRLLGQLASPPENAVSTTLAGLADLRQKFNDLRSGTDPQERLGASKAIKAIDGFIAKPPEGSVLAGDADQASDILQTANGNYAAGKRSDKVQGAGEYAQYKTAGANSGANFDNSLRQRLYPLLDPSKTQRLAGFTPDEKQQIAGVVQGTIPQNALRYASGAMGGGGGMGATVAGGAGALGSYLAGTGGLGQAAASVAVPLMGRGLRAAQNGIARGNLNDLDETLRMRSPLYRERQANAPITVEPSASGIAAPRIGAALMDDPSKGIYTQPEAGHPFYAKGGSVKKPTHEFLVNRLMKLAEKAKREEKKITAPILNMPDDAVTAALAKAQEAI